MRMIIDNAVGGSSPILTGGASALGPRRKNTLADRPTATALAQGASVTTVSAPGGSLHDIAGHDCPADDVSLKGGAPRLAAAVAEPGDGPTDFRPTTSYWHGRSGRLYRHSAHTAVFCPPPTAGVYVLVRRDGHGHPIPLFAGISASAAATLNLAKIRQRAASLGANEVHLCPLPTRGNVFSLRRALRDLRAAMPPLEPV
jgi:hypothetical protein